MGADIFLGENNSILVICQNCSSSFKLKPTLTQALFFCICVNEILSGSVAILAASVVKALSFLASCYCVWTSWQINKVSFFLYFKARPYLSVRLSLLAGDRLVGYVCFCCRPRKPTPSLFNWLFLFPCWFQPLVSAIRIAYPPSHWGLLVLSIVLISYLTYVCVFTLLYLYVCVCVCFCTLCKCLCVYVYACVCVSVCVFTLCILLLRLLSFILPTRGPCQVSLVFVFFPSSGMRRSPCLDIATGLSLQPTLLYPQGRTA